MARKKLPPDERRSQIIQAAQELFRSKGVKATSVSDIVKAVGVAQGTFYWYFESKEEVIRAVAQEYSRNFYASQISIANTPGLSALEKMLRIWEDSLTKYANNIALANYLHSEKNHAMHDQLLKESMQQLLPIMGDIIRQGVEEGAFAVQHLEETTMIFIAGLQGAHSLFNPSLLQSGFERRVRVIADFFFKGLGCTDSRLAQRIHIPVIMAWE